MTVKSILLSAAAAAATLVAAAPAQAVTFNLIDTGGTAAGSQARKGFEAAAFYWSSVLTNDVTINLNIGFSALAPGILGSTGSTTSVNFNSQVYGALGANITSSADASAVASLRPLSNSVYGNTALTVTTNALNATGRSYTDTATRVDADGSINNVAVAMNTSVDKALGITTDANGNTINYGLADGSITFSNAFSFDFNPIDGIDADSFDFIGVAIHEIGHALGFRSGVDVYDAYTTPGGTLTRAGALETAVVGTTLDLFRYTGPNTLNWSTQGTPYLSIDGGASQVFGNSWMSTGVRNGDGRQASHFRDSPAGAPQLGVMDPTSGRGQMQEITALDLVAFDVIGWQIAFDPLANPGYRIETSETYFQYLQSVPEPTTWAMMIAGVGLVGGAMRRRKVATTVSFA